MAAASRGSDLGQIRSHVAKVGERAPALRNIATEPPLA